MPKKILLLLWGTVLLLSLWPIQPAAVSAAGPANFDYVDLYTINKDGNTTGRDFKLWGIWHDSGRSFYGSGEDVFLIYANSDKCTDYLVIDKYAEGTRLRDTGGPTVPEPDKYSAQEMFEAYGFLKGRLSDKAWYWDNQELSTGPNGCKYSFKLGSSSEDDGSDTFNDEDKYGDVLNNPITLGQIDNSQISYYRQGDELIHAGNRGNMQFDKDTDTRFLRNQEGDECKDWLVLDGEGADRGKYQVRTFADGACQEEHKPPNDWVLRIGDISARPDLKAVGGTGGETSELDIQCQVQGGLGWVVCGVIGFIQEASNYFLVHVIKPFLEISPLRGDGNETVFKSWAGVRTLADVLLIPAFFVIIFSQALSLNIDAYTVKKMLPKLIAAAILIQFSFYIATIFVDIFNVLGKGIGDLLVTQVSKFGTDTAGNPVVKFQFGGPSSVFISLGVLVGGALAVLSGAIFTVLVPFLLSLVAVVFTLIFRQVLVVLLVILSPIAFLSWVLPNTQRIFKLWIDNFLRALLMYPMIVALFAASVILASLVNQGQFTQEGIGSLIAIAIATVPFMAVPLTFKFSGAAMSGIANGIQGLRGRGMERLQKSREKPKPGGMRERWNDYKNRTAVGGTKLARVPGASVIARPGLGFSKKDRSKAVTAWNMQVGEDMKEIDSITGLKPETKAYMDAFGGEYHTREGRKRFDDQIKHLRSTGKADNIAIADQMDNLRHLAGKDHYTAAWANSAMAAGQAGLDMSREDAERFMGRKYIDKRVDKDGKDIRTAEEKKLNEAFDVDDAGNVTGVKDGARVVMQGLATAVKGNKQVRASAWSSAGYHGKDKHLEHMMDRLDADGNPQWALETADASGKIVAGKAVQNIGGIQHETLSKLANPRLLAPHITDRILKGFFETDKATDEIKYDPDTGKPILRPVDSPERMQANHEVGELRYTRNSSQMPGSKAQWDVVLNDLTGVLMDGGAIDEPIPHDTPVGGTDDFLKKK